MSRRVGNALRIRSAPSLVVVLAALIACRSETARDAGPADIANAQAACLKESSLRKADGDRALAQFRKYCASAECEQLSKVAAVCYYGGRSKTPAHYHVYTTLLRSASAPRSSICEDMRASKAFGLVTPIHLYCATGEKPCTLCQTGDGSHR